MDKKLDTSLTIEFKDQFKMNLLRKLNLEKILFIKAKSRSTLSIFTMLPADGSSHQSSLIGAACFTFFLDERLLKSLFMD